MRRVQERLDLVGLGLMLLSSLQFGVVVVLGKVSTRVGLSVFTTLGVRFGVAALVLAAVQLALRQPLLPAAGERLGLVVLGVAGYAVEASFFFSALRHGTASAVTLLFFVYPVLVALASMALGRGAPGWLLGGALVCAGLGVALVVAPTGGLSIRPPGVAFALGSALTFTGYLIGADHVLKRTAPLTSAMWVSGSASLGLLALALVTGTAAVPSGVDQWGPLSGMGLATAGAFVTLLAGLRRLGAVRAAILGSTEPVAGSALAVAFLGEPLRAGLVGGGLLILAGAVTASVARPPPPAEPPMP